MTELIDWKKALVTQKDTKLGAIPAGFEWMLRFAKIENINFDTFQDEFNLKAKGEAENTFESIAKKIEEKYPHVKIKIKAFATGKEKVDFLKSLIDKNVPSLIKFPINKKHNACHEMPVYNYDIRYLRFIWKMEKSDNPDILRVEQLEIRERHDYLSYGKEIAWIEN